MSFKWSKAKTLTPLDTPPPPFTENILLIHYRSTTYFVIPLITLFFHEKMENVITRIHCTGTLLRWISALFVLYRIPKKQMSLMWILITQCALPSILSLKKIEIQNLLLVHKNVKLHSNLPVHVAVLAWPNCYNDVTRAKWLTIICLAYTIK